MFYRTPLWYALALYPMRGDAQFSFTNVGLSTLSSLSIDPTSTGSGYSVRTTGGQITVTRSRSTSSSATDFDASSMSDVTGIPSNSSASVASSSSGQTQRTTTSHELTVLVGTKSAGASSLSTRAGNSTMSLSSTSLAPLPSNTTPCNGYPELCSRRYSNITQICAHNSAFAIKNNAASNQEYGITTQLNDGVRMSANVKAAVRGETQLVNGTMYACHTSCDLLNAGTYESQLAEIADWVKNHPYDVVTILIGNSGWADGVTVTDYVDAIQKSGLSPYLYEPAYVPQYRSQWPTLSEMILSGKRVVMFIDYNANQTEVPYILDEYSRFFSTPFSRTDRNFPCTLQLPLELSEQDAREHYMYIANHNLNTPVSFAGYSILLPNTALINETNGMYNHFGQLGAMVQNCTGAWDRPPNFLVVDYYNRGDPGPGSVFQASAQANNVTYTRECCGSDSSSDAPVLLTWSSILIAGTALALWFNVL